MARPRKQTVDYFPHDCEGKKTLFTLENLYGNDGYAFWFKLLELLGQTEGHCYDMTKPADRLYLFSRAKVGEELGGKILKTLADLDAICPDLYQVGRLWSSNFVDRLRTVYDKRNTEIPPKPDFRPENPPNLPRNPQSKVKETKVKGSKGEKTFLPDSVEIRLSNLLLSKIKENNPGHKEPNLQGWAHDIDKILRIDAREVEQVERVIVWCQNDSFWQVNILSPAKLREKFDQLAIKMKANGGQNGNSRGSGKKGTGFAEARKSGETDWAS